MKPILDSALTVCFTMAAVTMAGTLVRREINDNRRSAKAQMASVPTFVENWNAAPARRLTLGKADAPVQIVEFADFECPACRKYQQVIFDTQKQFGDSVAVQLIHFPLTYHRFAIPAARASECAAVQDRFAAFANLLYEKQDSLGLKPWDSFAREAGIADSATFSRCASDTTSVPSILAGRDYGKEVGVKGTPGIMVNGWLFPGSPPQEELARVISDLLQKRPPFKLNNTGSP